MYKTYYYYDTDNRVNQVYDGGVQETYTYDSYGRLTDRVSNISRTKNVLNDKLTYQSGTNRVSSLTSTSIGNYNVTHSYTYDDNGNITSDITSLYDTSYVYDSANQLIRENNGAAGKTWVWTYDDAGNIMSRKEYAYTTANIGNNTASQSEIEYGYSTSKWGDLLTKFDGKTVSSDAIGNITSISGYRSYTWEHGRQLASSSGVGGNWTYSYNADGMRYRRTNGSTTYTYYYNGDLLRYLDVDSNPNDTVNGTKLYFVLDATGKPIEVSYLPEGGVKDDTTFYYYVHNLQGDVEALVDSRNGIPVVWYTYDAWGNVLSIGGNMASTLGKLNPFRYRSYVYDEESKLYYLQSRYYDPEMGRFICSDKYPTTGQDFAGNNMFAYCGNNPVSRSDDGGEFWNIVIGGAVGAALGAITQIASNAIKGEDLLWGVGMAAAVGGVGGAIAATSWSAPVQAIATGVISGVGDAIQQMKTTGKINVMQSVKAGIVGGITSAIGSYAGSKLFNGVEDLGNTLIQKGYSQAAKGVDRALRGLSHTSYYRSSAKALAMGKSIVNVYRGLSSTLGSFIGVVPGLANNLIEPYSP